MSVDREETPTSEKVQVQYANEIYSDASAAQANISAASIGDYRRTNIGKSESRNSAASAKASSDNLKKRRATKTKRIADTESINTDVKNLSIGGNASSKSGVHANNVSSSVSQTGKTLSLASSIEQKNLLDDFTRSNERTQMGIDVVTSVGQYYAYNNVDDGIETNATDGNTDYNNSIHQYDEYGNLISAYA